MNNSIINTVIVKIASPCNLNCTYCYVYNHQDSSWQSRPKFISTETFETAIKRISTYCQLNKLSKFTIVFHGGEPTLLKIGTFEQLIQVALGGLPGIKVQFAIQTNATLLDQDWAQLFLKYNVGVGISLDGDRLINDAARVFHSNRGSYSKIVEGIELLQKEGIEPHILCVINPKYSGLDVYNHFLTIGIKSMDFLIPDASYDSKSLLYGQFGETPVANYLIPIFDKWLSDDDTGIEIRLFKNLLKKILGGTMDMDCFGNPLMNYLIVETDGSIEVLDALRVCEHEMGKSMLNIHDSEFSDLYMEDSLVGKLLTSGVDLCDTCQSCEIRNICGGGYLPHRYSREKKFDNPSIWCADIKVLISHLREKMELYAPV